MKILNLNDVAKESIDRGMRSGLYESDLATSEIEWCSHRPDSEEQDLELVIRLPKWFAEQQVSIIERMVRRIELVKQPDGAIDPANLMQAAHVAGEDSFEMLPFSLIDSMRAQLERNLRDAGLRDVGVEVRRYPQTNDGEPNAWIAMSIGRDNHVMDYCIPSRVRISYASQS
jgi:hypothetical protein